MTLLRVVAFLAYPLLVFATLRWESPRRIAGILLALLVARMLLLSSQRSLAYIRVVSWPVFAFLCAIAIAAIWNTPLSLLLAPALGSVALLVTFARSLSGTRESVVEGFARAQLGELGEAEIRYCRRVTAVWCAFFLCNALVTAILAFRGALELWTLHTGLIAYIGMGTLIGVEYCYRQWRFRRYLGAPTDPLFRFLFPPRPG